MRKTVITALVALCAVLAFSSAAFAWGSAAHAWVDDHLGKKHGMQNNGELYGGMAADFFNFNFDDPASNGFVYNKTHEDFGRLWNEKSNRTRSFAVGFVSHNGLWGADRTAHSDGLTVGQDVGYVIAKATLMMQAIREANQQPLASFPDPLLLEICHNFVEYGIELLVKELDPLIGYKIVTAATFRSQEAPALIATAYADDLAAFRNISREEAALILSGTEEAFRQDMIMYGAALLQDNTTALDYLARRLAAVAAVYLAANGASLPDGIDLLSLIKTGILTGKTMCVDDFLPELNATTRLVARKLTEHKVR